MSSYRTARVTLATLLLIPLYLLWGLLWVLKGLHLLIAGLTYAIALMGADLMHWSYALLDQPMPENERGCGQCPTCRAYEARRSES